MAEFDDHSQYAELRQLLWEARVKLIDAPEFASNKRFAENLIKRIDGAFAEVPLESPANAGEVERLRALVYVPGVWRCAKCEFTLVQSNLNAADGSVTARDEPGDKCPNDGSPLWRVSYRDWALENEQGWERLLAEKEALIATLSTPPTQSGDGVTQADRETAASAGSLVGRFTSIENAQIRLGKLDEDPLVQAFARHRLAALTPDTSKEGADVREALWASQSLLEAIVRTSATDLQGVRKQVVANRTALRASQPPEQAGVVETEAAIAEMRESTIGRIVGPTIMLGSGTYFDFENPEAAQLTIEDVAFGLAFACRFAGQAISRATGKRVFYSVAEHCVRMSHIVPSKFAYDALMHELGEATCHDVTGPLKSLCPDYKRVEKRCEAAGLKRFNVAMSDPALIKRFDLVMLATEKRDLMPGADRHEWAWVKGAQPLDEVIEPWPAEVAASRFLDRYAALTAAQAGTEK